MSNNIVRYAHRRTKLNWPLQEFGPSCLVELDCHARLFWGLSRYTSHVSDYFAMTVTQQTTHAIPVMLKRKFKYIDWDELSNEVENSSPQ